MFSGLVFVLTLFFGFSLGVYTSYFLGFFSFSLVVFCVNFRFVSCLFVNRIDFSTGSKQTHARYSMSCACMPVCSMKFPYQNIVPITWLIELYGLDFKYRRMFCLYQVAERIRKKGENHVRPAKVLHFFFQRYKRFNRFKL